MKDQESADYQCSCHKSGAHGLWRFTLDILALGRQSRKELQVLCCCCDKSSLRKRGFTLADGSRGRAHDGREEGQQAAGVVLGAGGPETESLTANSKQRE